MKRLRAAVLAVVMLFAVVACGSSETSGGSSGGSDDSKSSTTTQDDEKTDAADAPSKADLDAFTTAVEQQVKKQYGTFNGVYSKISVDPVYPSGIEYVYDYAKPVDAKAAAQAIAKSAATLKTSFDTQIAPELESKGFSDPSAKFTYRNPDGTVIWTRTFSKS